MSETENDDATRPCDFCGATINDGVTDCLIVGHNETTICESCVAHCQAALEKQQRSDLESRRIPAMQPLSTTGKLRPITRIPKGWVICDTHFYKAIPYVTAKSSDGQKTEHFSVPKQLAHWLITYDEKLDVDKLREEIKKDLNIAVRKALLQY